MKVPKVTPYKVELVNVEYIQVFEMCSKTWVYLERIRVQSSQLNNSGYR